MVNETLKGLAFGCAYLDNIMIYSKTEWDHLNHIKLVFDQLGTANIELKMSKCDFFKSKIHYLGHLISQNGISPLPEKLDEIRTMSPPQNIKELRQFLGLSGYYRDYINHCTDIINSLTKLLKKDMPYIWTEIHKNPFQILNSA